MGSNFPPHRASPFLARAWFANQRRPKGLCLDTEPTSCISPGRPSRDERAVEGQSCSGEWLALAALISQSSPSRVSDSMQQQQQRVSKQRRDRQRCGGRTTLRVLANTSWPRGRPPKLLGTGRMTADSCVDCAYAPRHCGHLAAEKRAGLLALFQSF